MSDETVPSRVPEEPSEQWPARMRSLTPARIFRGRSGLGYRTGTQLELRAEHAAARDAVHSEINVAQDFEAGFAGRFGLIELQTMATSRQEFLRRPDLGRRLSESSRTLLEQSEMREADVQIAIGDGLSSEAVRRQVPQLLPRLVDLAVQRGWKLGRTVLIHRCRVGVMNDLGDLLSPKVVLLLIGERPGLATAESLSAYFAYRPHVGDTDASRNLISNIHSQGVSIEAAVERIVALVDEMLRRQISGYELKESFPAPDLEAISGQPPMN